MKEKQYTITPQEFANKKYAQRRINNFSGAAENTREDLAQEFPELTNDEINDIVFEATINFQEQQSQ